MHLDVVRKAFLTEPKSNAMRTDHICKFCLIRMLDHTKKLVVPVL